MTHIFYIHSNICVVSSYSTIEKLVNTGERVIIILERSTQFPYFLGKVETYNVQEVIDKYRRNSTTLLGKVINYRFTLYPQCKKFAKKIINGDDIIVYTPSYNMYSVRPFLDCKQCKGYYYIEDGTLSYLSANSLRRRYVNRRYRGGRILMDLLGAGEKPDCYISEKFRGCIGVSEFAYPWCKNKEVADVSGYYNNQPYDEIDVDDVIISDYLKDDYTVIIDAFKRVIDKIKQDNKPPRIGIKFHPSAYTYEKEKIERIETEIRNTYKNIDFIFFPIHYSIECMMFHKSIQLYCIFGASSLLLYALVLKSKAYRVNHNSNCIFINEIPTIQDYVDYSNSQYENG